MGLKGPLVLHDSSLRDKSHEFAFMRAAELLAATEAKAKVVPDLAILNSLNDNGGDTQGALLDLEQQLQRKSYSRVVVLILPRFVRLALADNFSTARSGSTWESTTESKKDKKKSDGGKGGGNQVQIYNWQWVPTARELKTTFCSACPQMCLCY